MFHACWCWEPASVLFSLPHAYIHPSYPRTPFPPRNKQVGAPLAGRVSDLMVKKWRKKRGGKWVAEDRLRAALFGATWLTPLSLALFGVANAYVDGTRGLVLCLVCLFINGIGVSSKDLPRSNGLSSDRRKLDMAPVLTRFYQPRWT